MSQPQFYLREILGGPGSRYIRKILVDGVYVDAPPVRHSPEFTAMLREVAMAEVQRIKAARMGEPPTRRIQ
jgi:hypothetical protein